MIPVRHGKILPIAPVQQDGLLRITLNNSDSVLATIPAMKHDKKKVVVMDWDDGLIGGHAALKAANITFTDGAGNSRLYAGGLALNSNYTVPLEKLQEMVLDGWDITNHGIGHIPYENENSVLGVHNELLADIGFMMGAGVVPQNFAGYHAAFQALGYIYSSTQNAGESGNWDGFIEWPTQYTDGDINSVPDQRFYVVKRDFANDWVNDDLAGWLAKLTGDVNLMIIGTHEFPLGEDGEESRAGFMAWVNNLKTTLGDDLIFCSLREYLEYVYVKNHALVTQQQTGNLLNIDIDFSNIPDSFSWNDISLKLPASRISSVTCSDNSFGLSYNPTTGLINLKKRKINWT